MDTNIEEIWKDIPGLEGHYQASTSGLIKGITGKIIKGTPDKNGYLRLTVHKDNRIYTRIVHRLVALTFIGPSNKSVDHIDGNKRNNCITNLRYCTTRENNTFYCVKKRNSLGASYLARIDKWQSQIKINGRIKYLGVHPTKELAMKAYQIALIDINNGKYQNNQGT